MGELSMRLCVVGVNQTVLEYKTKKIFFSYNTPVAAWTQRDGYLRTIDFYSPTTAKHIKAWLGDAPVSYVSQTRLNKLLH
jgi:hypothetical protein